MDIKPKLIKDGVSVIMATYNQGSFILGAINSLLCQTHDNWELIIIDDGSTDGTEEAIKVFISEPRISYYKNPENKGMGYSLNLGLDKAKYDYISYLPSDDLLYKDHLKSLLECLKENSAFVAYSGVRHHSISSATDNFSTTSDGQIKGFDVQLVQVLHQRTEERWLERDELVTDDLHLMFWCKLMALGEAVNTQRVTCEWVYHPWQRHKIISELHGGGIYKYKNYYNVKGPIKFKSCTGNFIDENKDYKYPAEKLTLTESSRPLKILIVGELAYNAERICCLEEMGHKLFGLWLDEPAHFTTIGPLPFGNIINLEHNKWESEIEEAKPDIIYALLNSQTVAFAHKILNGTLNIPFVWHFKEGPFFCRQWGNWPKLIDLFAKSNGQIYINEEIKNWFQQFLPSKNNSLVFILDGDLPKKNWFSKSQSPLISNTDGEIHTLMSGRPMGMKPEHIQELSKRKIHFHFYGEVYHGYWKDWVDRTKKLAGSYFHMHGNCQQSGWVEEFSKYDAGWLHLFESSNYKEIVRASWYDLNYPARIATLAVSGVPMIIGNNKDHMVATQSLVEKLNIGVIFSNFDDLEMKLKDQKEMNNLRDNVWRYRDQFTFDFHAEALVDFFYKVIDSH